MVNEEISEESEELHQAEEALQETTVHKDAVDNFDNLLNVVPSKLWFVLIGFIWLTLIGFLWLFLGTISIEMEGRGMLVENTCSASVPCDLVINSFFSLERTDNIKIGQKARIEFFNASSEFPNLFTGHVESIQALPASSTSIAALTTDPKLSEFLLGSTGIAAQVSLNITVDAEDQKKYAALLEKGMICKVHLIIEDIQPITMLLR